MRVLRQFAYLALSERFAYTLAAKSTSENGLPIASPIPKETTFDGFGRPIKVATGHGTTTVSTVETEYGPCACSALGKMTRQSLPYAPGQTPTWAIHTYDGAGRTLTVTSKTDDVTHSVTNYVYEGRMTQVTDPKGKWKKFTTDEFGNLVQVEEPGSLFTYYTYTALDKLATVSMTRGGVTAGRARSPIRTARASSRPRIRRAGR